MSRGWVSRGGYVQGVGIQGVGMSKEGGYVQEGWVSREDALYRGRVFMGPQGLWIQLTSGLYTSYWNAFLLFNNLNEYDLTL